MYRLVFVFDRKILFVVFLCLYMFFPDPDTLKILYVGILNFFNIKAYKSQWKVTPVPLKDSVPLETS